jgi:hypothetical protein
MEEIISENTDISNDNTKHLQGPGFGLERSGLRQSAVVGYYEHCNEPLVL